MGVKLANAASPGNAIPPKISGGVAYAVAKLQKAGTGTHLTSGDERQPIPRKRPQISCSRLAHNDAGGKYRKPNCQCSAPNPKKLPEVATSSLRAIVEVSPEGRIELASLRSGCLPLAGAQGRNGICLTIVLALHSAAIVTRHLTLTSFDVDPAPNVEACAQID
jgi:hypothetical protein